MRWTPGGRSSDLEDRRGSSGGGFGGGGMRIGLGGAAVLLVLSLVFKQNFFALLGGGGAGAASRRPPDRSRARRKRRRRSSSSPSCSTMRRPPGSAIFRPAASPTSMPSWCCSATPSSRPAASPRPPRGPFYCPGDEKVYIDLGFYDELQQRFGAPGDFAQAYVLAHELGHHVQHLLGTEAQVRERAAAAAATSPTSCRCGSSCRPTATPASGATRPRSGRSSRPETSRKASAAAAAVGDDRIQRMRGRACHPEGFTHGSSEQRASWFRRGFESGRPEDCDTFKS